MAATEHLTTDTQPTTTTSKDAPTRTIHAAGVTFAYRELGPRVCANDERVAGSLIGLLVIDGVVVRETMLGPHISAQLCGPGDLLELPGARDQRCLPVLATISVPGTAVLALLDDRVLAASRRWPRLAGRLVAQALGQIGDVGAHQTISQLPRVEDRLLALFWHLADRWGRVLPDGVRIDLPLTHETIGRLIGARRPTVTLGLRAAADRRLPRTARRCSMAARSRLLSASHHSQWPNGPRPPKHVALVG